jgi:hypothetical protein
VTPHQAAARWQKRQTQLLARTYQQAWQHGANTYRTQHTTPLATPVTPTGGTLPANPNAQAMSRALAPALASLAAMAATIATLVPTAAMLAAAKTAAEAFEHAVRAYLVANGWRLAGGVSVAWAGRIAGYAESADADGMRLQWLLDPSPTVHHCADCPALAQLPPMPLSWWPTLPGDGLTECSVGCKCGMRAVAAAPPTLTADQHELISRIGNRQPVLLAA